MGFRFGVILPGDFEGCRVMSDRNQLADYRRAHRLDPGDDALLDRGFFSRITLNRAVSRILPRRVAMPEKALEAFFRMAYRNTDDGKRPSVLRVTGRYLRFNLGPLGELVGRGVNHAERFFKATAGKIRNRESQHVDVDDHPGFRFALPKDRDSKCDVPAVGKQAEAQRPLDYGSSRPAATQKSPITFGMTAERPSMSAPDVARGSRRPETPLSPARDFHRPDRGADLGR